MGKMIINGEKRYKGGKKIKGGKIKVEKESEMGERKGEIIMDGGKIKKKEDMKIDS